MKLESLQAALGAAIAILSISPVDASLAHRHLHHLDHRHSHLHVHRSPSPAISGSVLKRGGSCQFPNDDPNLVAITPNAMNAGWAMSPDQECKPGNYCPIACKPGMVMAQWDPHSTYTYPASMNGGLYCDKSGKVHKPFPNKPYCVPGTGSVKAVNKCAKPMSWCQTILPGCESMLIPTLVQSVATIAVPDPSYWQSTASHFYINPPGSGPEDCIWGTSSKPIGNWSPYVAGANTDGSGQTFVKIAYNPVWQSSGLSGSKPDFGVRVECPGGGCNGLPCEIRPGGKVNSEEAAVGAGGSSFCVVTVPKGKTAHIVAFDGSGGNGGDSEKSPRPTTPKKTSSSSSPPPPPPPPTTTSEAEPATTSTTPSSTYTPPTTSSEVESSTEEETPTSTEDIPTVLPGIFHESSSNTTTVATTGMPTPSNAQSSSEAPPKTKSKENDARRQQGSAATVGLIAAFVATACLF